MTIAVAPGDVLLVRNKGTAPTTRLARWAIQLGAWLEGTPTTWTHVIVVDHTDKTGTLWGMEGRPGGVGPVDVAPYLNDSVTLSNTRQPKGPEQRRVIVSAMSALVGRAGYDWAAIAVDAAIAIAAAEHLEQLGVWRLRDQWTETVPGHVVCSALADWAYERAGLDTPKRDRYATPGDWAKLIKARGWS